MDECGERQNELRTELRSGRRNIMLFQEVGAPSWILERRNGLSREIYNRLREDDRLSGKRVLAGVQWRLNTRISGGSFSANRMVFGSDLADRHGQEERMRT